MVCGAAFERRASCLLQTQNVLLDLVALGWPLPTANDEKINLNKTPNPAAYHSFLYSCRICVLLPVSVCCCGFITVPISGLSECLVEQRDFSLPECERVLQLPSLHSHIMPACSYKPGYCIYKKAAKCRCADSDMLSRANCDLICLKGV